MKKIEAPELRHEDGPIGGDIYTHPAFGQISASRISATPGQPLYGSDFLHNHYIMIRIAASDFRRSLSHDWHHPGKEYIEVSLSEAQWATFVSSLNQGQGPCCTIEHVNGKRAPGLPNPVDRSEQFAGEVTAKLDECLKRLRESIADIDQLGIPKCKAAAAKASLEKTLQDLTCNLPFVAKSFGEHTEKVVEKAKQEVHGYMENVLMRAGIAAIEGGKLPLEIEHKPKQPS